MSTIVLNSLNYIGSGLINGVSWFWERAAGIAAGFSNLSFRCNITPQRTNCAVKLVIPTVASEDSECGCVGELKRTAIVDVSVRFDAGATLVEREDVYNRLKDLVGKPEFAGLIKQLQVPV